MSLRNLHRGMKLIVIKRQGLLIKRCRFMFFACSAIPMKLFRMERKVSNKLGNLFTVTSCLWRSLRSEEISPVTCYRIKPFAVALPLVLIIFCFSFVEHNFVINWTIISFISFVLVCVCAQASIVRRAHAAAEQRNEKNVSFSMVLLTHVSSTDGKYFIQPANHSRFFSSYFEVRWHLIPLETHSFKASELDRWEGDSKTMLKAERGRVIFPVYIALKQYKQKCSWSLCFHLTRFGKLCVKMFANFDDR